MMHDRHKKGAFQPNLMIFKRLISLQHLQDLATTFQENIPHYVSFGSLLNQFKYFCRCKQWRIPFHRRWFTERGIVNSFCSTMLFFPIALPTVPRLRLKSLNSFYKLECNAYHARKADDLGSFGVQKEAVPAFTLCSQPLFVFQHRILNIFSEQTCSLNLSERTWLDDAATDTSRYAYEIIT
jgi:hypothetical protein